MKFIFLDIETVPVELHDDVKEYFMNKKISKDSRQTHPMYARTIVICAKEYQKETKIFNNADEKSLLEDFWNFMAEKFAEDPKTIIVTHNGYKFDIPFLILRSHINGIKIPVQINTNRFNMMGSNHFDTLVFFSFNETFTYPNLEILCKMFGIKVHERLTGNEIIKCYKKGNIQEIIEHCKNDVEILEKLFDKVCMHIFEK